MRRLPIALFFAALVVPVIAQSPMPATDVTAAQLKLAPAWDPLRSDPRFPRLTDRSSKR